jgi:hypothetical protein
MQASELVEHAGAADELARRDPDLARDCGRGAAEHKAVAG